MRIAVRTCHMIGHGCAAGAVRSGRAVAVPLCTTDCTVDAVTLGTDKLEPGMGSVQGNGGQRVSVPRVLASFFLHFSLP